jgi:multiple sugar transport system substrate-binding protein
MFHAYARPFGGRLLRFALALLALLAAGGCRPRPADDRSPDGRVTVTYWEKWTGFEGEAMDEVIRDFHAAQDRIRVKKLTVSQIDRKLMLATAGGNPPDLAGVWSHTVNDYAEKGALTPLDRLLAEAGIGRTNYIPVMWDLCGHRGFQWALPTTPATVALHWNRKLFRDAGLDPDQPPRSLAELDAMAERLTLVEVERAGQRMRVRFPDLTPAEKEKKNFRILQLGHLPQEPGWFREMWGYWFGSELWDGERTVTADHPGNREAFAWFESYTRKYGLDNIRTFGASFGNFASPQNPFLAGQIAMVLQGVWMHNFIGKYAPHLEWGVAPFPARDPERWPAVTIAECDVLVIPRGSRHPREAFEFIRYVNTRGPMEKLCLGQRKFSPLAELSPDFIARHPNPHIAIFIELARSPNARTVPRITIWNEYKEELLVAADQVTALLKTPEAALATVQQRSQWKLDRVLRRWDLVQAERQREWSEYDVR